MADKRMVNKIDRELLVDAQKKLDEVMALLKPCFEILIQPELWAQEKIDERTVKFLTLSHDIAGKFPEMFPGFRTMEVFNEDILSIQELYILARKAGKLKDKVNRLIESTGNQNLDTAKDIYRIIGIAARHDIPGAGILFEELKATFPRKKREGEKVRGKR